MRRGQACCEPLQYAMRSYHRCAAEDGEHGRADVRSSPSSRWFRLICPHSFDVEKWLKVNYPLDEKGLPVEASLASKDGSAKPSGAVQVELATAADVEARKRKEEEEEIAKRCGRSASPVDQSI